MVALDNLADQIVGGGQIQAATETEKTKFRQELATLLEKFEQQPFTPGRAPGESQQKARPISLYKVESWIQVPLILEKLAQGEDIRLEFPQPKNIDPSLVDTDQIAMHREQGDISKFFAERHSKSLKDIEAELSTKIKDCFRFQQAAERSGTNTDFDALREEVAKNYRLNHSKKTAKSTSIRLAVSVVYEEKHLKDPSQTAAVIAEVVKHRGAFPKPKIIFDAGSNPAGRTALAKELEKASTDSSIDPATKSIVEAITEVWAPEPPQVTPSATSPAPNPFDYLVFRRDGFVQRYKNPVEDTSVAPLKPEEYLPIKSAPVQDEHGGLVKWWDTTWHNTGQDLNRWWRIIKP